MIIFFIISGNFHSKIATFLSTSFFHFSSGIGEKFI